MTVRDAAGILGLSEKEIIELAEDGSLPAYKIGGVYLRFKQQQIEEYRKKMKLLPRKHTGEHKYSPGEGISDFFYFNDFYIISALIVIFILLIIFQG